MSTNGIVEYTASTFASKLQGDLFYVSLIDGLLGRVQLSGDGTSVVSNTTFADSFVFPLDITVGDDGTIYVAEFGAGVITFLKPNAPAPVGGISLDSGLRGLSDSLTGSLAVWLVGSLIGAMLVSGSLVVGAAAYVRRRS